MTVPTPANNLVTYIGTGLLAVYPIPYMYFQSADIQVAQATSTGTAASPLVEGTDYTISAPGFATGGTLTLLAGNLPIGYVLSAFLNPIQEQNTELPNGGPYYGSTIESALDLSTQIEQSLQRQVSNAMRAPATETTNMLLPAALTRALKYPAFDSAGNLVLGPAAASPGTIPDYGLDQVIATIAALKALPLPINAVTYLVKGYATANDGGQGQFVWNASDSRADNGGTIIALNIGGTGRFNRLTNGVYSASWFGVLGTADDSTVLQQALNVAATDLVILVFAPRIYHIVTHLRIPSKTILFAYGVTITPTAAMNRSVSPILISDPTFVIGANTISIYGLGVDGNGAARVTGTSGGANFYISAATQILLADCVSQFSTQEGIQIAGDTTFAGGLSTSVTLRNCRSEGNHRNGLSLTGTDRVTIEGGEYNSSVGADPQSGIDIEPNSATSPNKDFTIWGVSCVANTKWGISIYNSTFGNTGSITGVNLSLNGISGLINTATPEQVRIQGVTGHDNVTSLIATPTEVSGAQSIDLAETNGRPYLLASHQGATGGHFTGTSYASSGYALSVTFPKLNCTLSGSATFNCLIATTSGTVAEATLEIRDELANVLAIANLRTQSAGNGANAIQLDVPVTLQWSASNSAVTAKTFTMWIKVTAGTTSVDVHDNYCFTVLAIPN